SRDMSRCCTFMPHACHAPRRPTIANKPPRTRHSHFFCFQQNPLPGSRPMSNCHQVNEDTLSHELIDGEVVIIQFDTGNYYSLAGTAADLWERLLSPATTADLLA